MGRGDASMACTPVGHRSHNRDDWRTMWIAALRALSREFRLPSIGGLISYGPNNFQLIKQAGGIAGKILRGANPAEFPIQRPIYVSFPINTTTAKLLQLAIPPSLAALADE